MYKNKYKNFSSTKLTDLYIEMTPEEEEIFNKYGSGAFIIKDDECIVNPDFEQEQEQKEKERIQNLSITRSDFFDATIMAFGADEDDFLPIIENILAKIPETLSIIKGVPNTIAIKMALNNYKNAGDFYRKHPLFTILSNIPIEISAELTINITTEQWDKFFDEANKKNPKAYKYLIANP